MTPQTDPCHQWVQARRCWWMLPVYLPERPLLALAVAAVAQVVAAAAVAQAKRKQQGRYPVVA